MAEYIEREAAIDACFNGWNNDAHDCAENIRLIPAADVRPVVRGHIEEDENTYLYCSECNCNITLAAYATPDNRLVLRPNYCPNCGADMREES